MFENPAMISFGNLWEVYLKGVWNDIEVQLTPA